MSRVARALLFDLDETLYPERRFALSGFAAVARGFAPEAGVAPAVIFRTLVGALRRGERAKAFQHLCVSLGWPETRVAALVDAFRRHDPALRLPVDSSRTLTLLRSDWRLAIVTNGPASIQARKVQALGLGRLVDAVVYASLSGKGEGKPAPEPFLAAVHRVRVPPARCVFVGDDPTCDVGGARRLGMKTIRIARSGARHPAPGTGGEADAVVESIGAVPWVAATLLGDEALCA